jgi:uncharacterized Zn ribbon protein
MFNLRIEAVGDVFSVKKNKKEDKDAKLQFLNDGEDGAELIDVKVKGAKSDDLVKFKGKKVRLKNINLVKIDFNTFYSIDDISKIEEIK